MREKYFEDLGLDDGQDILSKFKINMDEILEESKEHEDKKHAVEKTSKGEASAQDYEALPAAQTTAPVPAFQPIYKVSCKANNVKYSCLRRASFTASVR